MYTVEKKRGAIIILKKINADELHAIEHKCNSLNGRLGDLRYQFKPTLSVEELSDIIGIPVQTIYDYEREGNPVPPAAIIKYATVFGVSTDYLYGISPTMQPVDIDIRGLGLSEHALKNLRDNKIAPWLISEIIEHELFDDILIDAYIYVTGYIDDTIQQYNATVYSKHNEILNKIGGAGQTFRLDQRLSEGLRINQDVLFTELLTKKFLTVFSDLRNKHKNDSFTSNMPIGKSSSDIVVEAIVDAIDKTEGTPQHKIAAGIFALLKISPSKKSFRLMEKILKQDENLERLLGKSAIIEPNARKRSKNPSPIDKDESE